jgi:glycogen synthase
VRILVLSNIFPPGFIGGYELGALDMVRGLISRGHVVEVMTSDHLVDDEGALEFCVHRVLQYGAITRSPSDRAVLALSQAYIIPANIRQLVSVLIRFRPEQILCFNLAYIGPAGLLQCLAAIGYRPVLFLMDNVLEGYALNPTHRRAYEKSFGLPSWIEKVKCVFMSRNIHTEFEAALGRSVPDGSIIPGWFDRALVPALPARSGPSPCRAIVKFIFASRLTPHKGIDIILEAARILLDHGHGQFTVDVVGNGEVAQMLHRRHALELQTHVAYLGVMEKRKLLACFSDYDALLFPTWPREPFGFVVCEAAAAGCLPVMTAGIGASEWFLDGIDSLKTSPAAPDLAAAMIRLITMSTDERDVMRGRAQETARRFFGFDRALASLEAVLLKGNWRAPPMVSDPPAMRAIEASLEVLADVWRRGMHD